MLRSSLRFAFTLMCALGLLVAPALAGDGAKRLATSQPALGGENETPTAWFVELSGAPGAEGGNKAALRAERDEFELDAKADGINLRRRFSFDTLWNGMSVTVSAKDVSALGSIPGVKAVYPVVPLTLPPSTRGSADQADPDLASALPMTGADVAQSTLGYTGAGVKVAIIDSGVDYTNPDLSDGFGRGHRVAGGYDLVGDDYDTNPFNSTYQPVPHPDPDPAPCDPNVADARAAQPGAGESDAGHGTHVAGIVGAKAAGPGGVTGVAPGVTLLAYKVFGCNGSTDSDILISAMERAREDGANVVNISIGGGFENWPGYPDAVAASRLVRSGVNVVASIGNNGASGLWSAGAPGVGRDVLGVASFENTNISALSFDVTSGATTLHVPYLLLADTPEAPTSGLAGQVVYVGRGCVADPTLGIAGDDPYLADPDGKVALIVRGTCPFDAKYRRAVEAGATAVVIMNQGGTGRNGIFSGGFTDARNGIPGVTISFTDGEAIRALAAPPALTWTAIRLAPPNENGNLVSDFSSWGTDAELGLKPDLGAPGGFIRSTWPMTQFGGHNVISGTSMASPHVAGAVALLLQARGLRTPPAVVRSALLSTAVPREWNLLPDLGIPDATWRQGAGLLQIDKAIKATSLVVPSKISLGEGNGGSETLVVTNEGTTAVTYDLSSVDTVGTGPSSTPGVVFPFGFDFFGPVNQVSFRDSSVTVPARGRVTLAVRIAPDPTLPDQSLYGGYVVFAPRDGGTMLHVPYVGFKGDYQSLEALTPAGCDLPALVHVSGGAAMTCSHAPSLGGIERVGSAGATFTMQGADIPIVLYHLNHQVRKLDVEVFRVSGSTFRHVFDSVAKEEFLPRNSTATSFFEFDWDGTRGHANGRRDDRRKALPNGTYVLRLRVLKALGDERRSAHWETWTSPPIRLALP